MERPPLNVVRLNRCGEALLRRSCAERIQKFEALYSHDKCRKDLSNHSINDPTLLKRKETANDGTTSTWQGLSRTTEPSLAVNRYDKENNNSPKESDYAVDPKTGWRSNKDADNFVIVAKLGSNQLEDEQLEFSALFEV